MFHMFELLGKLINKFISRVQNCCFIINFTYMSLNKIWWSIEWILDGVFGVVNVFKVDLIHVRKSNNLVSDLGRLTNEDWSTQVLDDKTMTKVDSDWNSEIEDTCCDWIQRLANN